MVVLFLHNGVMSISTTDKILYKGVKFYEELKNNLSEGGSFFQPSVLRVELSLIIATNRKTWLRCETSGISDIVIKKLNHYHHGR